MKKILTVLLLALVIAGCASNQQMMHQVNSEVQFIVDMIPHHQEAVDISRVVLETTQNAEVRDLANRIIVAQEREIAMMQGWLDEWYPDRTYESNYMNMMPDLESLQGEARDNAYLEGMIEHHMMAVMMAKQVLKLEPREEVASFANEVISVQSSEIMEMQELLE